MHELGKAFLVDSRTCAQSDSPETFVRGAGGDGGISGCLEIERKFGTDLLGIWPVRTGIFGTNLGHPEGRISAYFPRTPWAGCKVLPSRALLTYRRALQASLKTGSGT